MTSKKPAAKPAKKAPVRKAQPKAVTPFEMSPFVFGTDEPVTDPDLLDDGDLDALVNHRPFAGPVPPDEGDAGK